MDTDRSSKSKSIVPRYLVSHHTGIIACFSQPIGPVLHNTERSGITGRAGRRSHSESNLHDWLHWSTNIGRAGSSCLLGTHTARAEGTIPCPALRNPCNNLSSSFWTAVAKSGWRPWRLLAGRFRDCPGDLGGPSEVDDTRPSRFPSILAGIRQRKPHNTNWRTPFSGPD